MEIKGPFAEKAKKEAKKGVVGMPQRSSPTEAFSRVFVLSAGLGQ
jgi:hypothetical protein